MSFQQFVVTDTNPNDAVGGGGCVCDPRKITECKPPYVVCTVGEMYDPQSPHVVICQRCAEAMVKACDGEVLSTGDAGKVVEPQKAAVTQVLDRDRDVMEQQPHISHEFDDFNI